MPKDEGRALRGESGHRGLPPKNEGGGGKGKPRKRVDPLGEEELAKAGGGKKRKAGETNPEPSRQTSREKKKLRNDTLETRSTQEREG